MIEALTAGRSRAYVPVIRAAGQWQRRPTAAIMTDDWFGHRNPFTGEEIGDKDEWTEWDYALISAFQVIEDYSDQYGILKWVHDTPWVDFDAKREIHKFDAARDEKTSAKNYKPQPGEQFIPDMYTKSSSKRDEDGSIQTWTFREWIESKVENGK